jgi:hypothetical protein
VTLPSSRALDAVDPNGVKAMRSLLLPLAGGSSGGETVMGLTKAAAIFFTLGLTGWLNTATAAEPIATTDGETPGMRLEITELKFVSGGALMLKFTVINDSDKDSRILGNIATAEAWSADGVYLVDVPGKKKYLVVRDAENHCVCSRGLETLAPKGRVNVWAKFPAPPDAVQKIGVVVPHFIPADDVPISR